MRRITFAAALLVLLACPKPPVTEPPPGGADPDRPAVALPPPPAGCEAGPGWLALAPCVDGETLYVVGEMSGDNVLARAGALNRARARMIELGYGQAQADGSTLLEQSEGWDSFSCAGKSFALARRPADQVPSSPWPACPAVVTGESAVGDCPSWTRRSAWREGSSILAVGAVQGIKNPAMAATAARNRALAEAQKVVAVSLTVTPGGVSARSSAPAGLPGGVETAICGDTFYAKVTVNAP